MGFVSVKIIPALDAAVVLRIIASIPQKTFSFVMDKRLKVIEPTGLEMTSQLS
jgi:hypothetical protein